MARLSVDALYIGIQVDGVAGQSIGEPCHKAFHSLFWGKRKPVTGAASRIISSRATECCLKQTAIRALEFDELRHRGCHAEFFRIGRVNSGDERLHEALENFAAKSATRKRCDTL